MGHWVKMGVLALILTIGGAKLWAQGADPKPRPIYAGKNDLIFVLTKDLAKKVEASDGRFVFGQKYLLKLSRPKSNAPDSHPKVFLLASKIEDDGEKLELLVLGKEELLRGQTHSLDRDKLLAVRVGSPLKMAQRLLKKGLKNKEELEQELQNYLDTYKTLKTFQYTLKDSVVSHMLKLELQKLREDDARGGIYRGLLSTDFGPNETMDALFELQKIIQGYPADQLK